METKRNRVRYLILIGAVILVGYGIFSIKPVKQRILTYSIKILSAIRPPHINEIPNIKQGELAITCIEGGEEEARYTFEDYDLEAVHRGNLILVNSYYPYHFLEKEALMAVADYKNRFYKVGDQKMTLSRPMLSAINQLMADFQQATGKDDMILTSGYRSLKDQNDALQEKINEFGKKEALKWAMLPGYSEHHTGYAVDMSIYTDEELYIPYKGQDEYAWINQNCFKYGIVRRYTEDKVAITGIGNEPWHYRYVGIPHAYLMTVKDLCLEEYIDYLRQFSFQGEHLRLATEEGNFEIYYVAAAPKGKTHLPVPKDTPYTVSGNNVDGFIITTYET